MFSLLAILYHTARLAFEAQNAMTFRLLRLVSDAGKLVADEAPTNLVTSLPDEPLVPLAAPREVKVVLLPAISTRRPCALKSGQNALNVTGWGLSEIEVPQPPPASRRPDGVITAKLR